MLLKFYYGRLQWENNYMFSKQKIHSIVKQSKIKIKNFFQSSNVPKNF